MSESAQLAVDPDLGPRPSRRPGVLRGQVSTIAVIAVGGGLGALARYGIGLAIPTKPGEFPWGTFLINVLGCFCIGVLMVLITEVCSAHPLVRPFVGVGVLGGFTTFSTYANEVRGLLKPSDVALAFGYLAGTLLCALLSVIAAAWLTRLVCGVGRRA